MAVMPDLVVIWMAEKMDPLTEERETEDWNWN